MPALLKAGVLRSSISFTRLKSRCWWDWLLLDALGEGLSPGLFQLLEAPTGLAQAPSSILTGSPVAPRTSASIVSPPPPPLSPGPRSREDPCDDTGPPSRVPSLNHPCEVPFFLYHIHRFWGPGCGTFGGHYSADHTQTASGRGGAGCSGPGAANRQGWGRGSQHRPPAASNPHPRPQSTDHPGAFSQPPLGPQRSP